MANTLTIARVSAIQGQAYAKDKAGNLRPLKVGDPIYEGDVVMAAEGSRVDLASDDGRSLVLRANEMLTADAEVFGSVKPDAVDSAIKVGGADVNRVIQTINQGGSLDALLEETAAGDAGTGADGGPSFVRLLRISESVDPLSFEFDTARQVVVNEEVSGGRSDVLVEEVPAAADATTVTLTASSASVGEGGSIIYTATVNAAVTGSPLVITLSNGQTITIPVGSSTADSAPYTVRGDDAYVQGTDTLTVGITGTSGGKFEALTTTSTVATDVTDDADATTVTLTASSASVGEGGSIIYTATVNAAVTGSPLVITLSNGQTITIPVGSSTADSAPYTVRGDDAYVQGTDTLTVGITGTSGGKFEALTTTSTVATDVTDDADATTVTLTASSASVGEGGSIIYTATVNAAVTGSPLVITLSNGQTITIPVGSSTADSAPYTVRGDDAYVQGTDTLTVGITGTSGGKFEALTTTSTVATDVTDDADATTVTLTASSASVGEGGSIIYTATVNAAVTGSPLVITLSNGQTITIPVGSSTADSAPYTVRGDDAYVQGTDTLTVGITGTSGGKFEALTTTSTVATDVTDDADATTVTLTASSASVGEGGSIIYTATVNAAVTGSPLVITLSNGQTITIPVGSSTADSAPYTVRGDDAYVQGTDTLTVGITGTSGGKFEALTTTSTVATDVTDDADATTVTLTASSASVGEGGSIIYTATVNAAVTGSPLVITLSNGQTITIPVGSSTADSAPYTVRGDDAYVQGTDTLTVGITGTSGGKFEALTTTSTVATDVTDDADATTVTLTASSASVGEGGSIIYTATVNAAVTGSPLVITLSNGQTITIPVGSSTADSAPYTVRGDDAYVQGTDTLTVGITGTSGGKFEALTTTSTVATDVTDDADATTVRISGDASITEGATGSYTISLTSPAQGSDVTVTLTYSGTAANGSDFTGTTTVTIPAGQTSASFNIATLDDSLAEGTENFTITLSEASGGNFENLVVAGSGAGGDITTDLVDNDTASVVITDAGSVVEANGNYLVFDVKLSNAVAANTTVTLSLTGGATSGADYTNLQYFNGTAWVAVPANNQITLPATGDAVQVRVAVLDDTATENAETVILNAGSSSNPLVSTGDTGTGTITDDRGGDNPNVDADTTASVVITDAGSVVEANGNYLVFDVKLSNAVAANTTVTLSLTGGATSGADYTNLQYFNGTAWVAVPANNQITLPATGDAVQVRVAVLDDTATENAETVILNAGSSSNPLVSTGDTGTGTITDDRGGDNPNVDADTTASVVITDAGSVVEANGNYLVFDVKLSNAVAANTTVTLSLTGGATSGADYTNLQYFNGTAWVAVPANNQITLPATGDAVQVRVAVLDDTATENAETVILNAGSSSNPLVSTGDTGTGTITDETTVGPEDTVYARLVNVAGIVTESGALTHRLELVDVGGNPVTVPAGGSISVTLVYGPDSTTLADFSGSRVTSVTIPAGQSSILISNQTLNDTIFEGNEGYTLTLGTVTDHNASFEAVATHSTNYSVTGTILDNETAPTLSVSSTTVAESAGFAVFEVKLSTPSALATSVALALGGGSATGSGVDYGSSGATNLQISTNGGLTWSNAGSYTFVPGATSVLVRTPVTEDAVYEPGGETFNLTATRTGGQTANLSAAGTATITDNDAQPSLSVSDAFIAEGGRLAFVVSLSNPSSQSVSVNYATGSPTGTNLATAGTDYTSTSGTLTFNPGETSKIVYVQTLADAASEQNERLALNLGTSVNATIADAQGIGTIMERVQGVPDSATVYESALSDGTVPSSSGETVSGNLLVNDYTPSGTLRVDQVTFGGTNYSIPSGGSTSINTALGTLQVFSNGTYTYTLNTNSTGGDAVSEQFGYRITNGSTSSTSNLTINIADDAPIGSDVTHTLQAASSALTYNLVLTIDVSGSMAQDANGRWQGEAGFDPTTVRMVIAKDALADLIQRFDGLGNVNVQIVSFSSTATKSAWFNDNPDAAIDYINSLQAGGGTQYSTAISEVMNGFTKPSADKTLFYFVSDGLPNDGYDVSATLQSTWQNFVTSQGTTSAPSLSFGVGIGEATLNPLRPIAFPNTDANADGNEDYAIKVSNPNDLSATLLATVNGGVVLGNVSVLSGSGAASGLLMGADGGQVQSVVVDGVTYSYTAGGPQIVMITTLKGGELTVNFITGSYEYHLTVNQTIQGQQEVFRVTGVDADGDAKAINLQIDLNYVANLDANRDTILTNVAGGTPIVVPNEALLHNDSKQGTAALSGVQNASGGSVSQASGSVSFVAGAAGVPATTIGVTTEAPYDGSDSGLQRQNDNRQNAIDFTDRTKFGTVLPGGQAWTVDQTGYSRVFSGSINNTSSSVRDIDYVKVKLFSGERLFVDVDNATTAAVAQVEYQDVNGVWQTMTVANDASGYANGWVTAPVDGEFYVRLTTTGSTDTNYNLVLTVDQIRGPIGSQSGQFDYTVTENGASTSATATVEHVAGTTINGTRADEILIGGATNDTLKGFEGNDALYGNVGNDVLQGGVGHDLLDGGVGSDTLDGGQGLDRLVGGAGNDTLTGGLGADVFAWKLGDQGTSGTPAHDNITDFDTATGSDKLDLRDLLQGEIANPAMQNLSNYLHFEKSGLDTIVHISSNGGFASDTHTIGGAFSTGSEDQKITLQNVDLTVGFSTDQQIIQDLLNKGKLITD